MMLSFLSIRIVPIRLSYNPFSGSCERRNAALLRADEQRRLQRERRRGAAGRSLAHLDRGLRRLGERDESNGTKFGLKRDHRTIENRSGGTHPGAEHGAMRGSLMLGMVPGMFDRLRLSQSADNKNAEH